MSVETSKQPENSSSQLSREITEGKRKWVSYREALSLQDVFSDSGDPSGSSQKTYLPSDIERRKGAQLERKANRRPAEGRRKLKQYEKRAIKLQMLVTVKEYENLNDQFQSTWIRYFSDYLRLLILENRRSGNITNKKELIKKLDAIGVQIGMIGNYINQIA